MPEEEVKALDAWVTKGRFQSRSDAIKTIVAFYKEREKTREFYEMLEKRSKEAREHAECLVELK